MIDKCCCPEIYKICKCFHDFVSFPYLRFAFFFCVPKEVPVYFPHCKVVKVCLDGKSRDNSRLRVFKSCFSGWLENSIVNKKERKETGT